MTFHGSRQLLTRKLKGPKTGIEMVEIDLGEAKTCRVQTQRPNRLRRRVTPKERPRSERTKGLGQKERSRESWRTPNNAWLILKAQKVSLKQQNKNPTKNKTSRPSKPDPPRRPPKREPTETKVQPSANECLRQLDKPGGLVKC